VRPERRAAIGTTPLLLWDASYKTPRRAAGLR